ncbi:hypothetical protein QR680_011196 [Steinernema hermaphroditum]|uniref:Uncharacterized protein n=1 Tax=Steinernema hermaphroditum TaxID=289476 RepID=A0AA39MCF2_9BILA|nr:hypothetical protein QR680_011196 [Steinernema hermaphroditum]
MAETVHYGVAAINLCGLTVFLPCNLLMAWAIYKRSDLWEQWSLKILLNINIAGAVYLLPTAIAAAFSVAGMAFSDYLPLLAFLDLETMPVIQGLLCLTLAFNRFVVFGRWSHLDRKEIYRICLTVSWCCGVFWLLVYLCTLKSSFYYNFDKHTFEMETIVDDFSEAITHRDIYNIKSILCAVWFGLIVLCAAFSLAILCLSSHEIKNEEVGIFYQTLIPVAFLIASVIADHYSVFFIRNFGKTLGPMVGVFMFRVMPASIHAIVMMIVNKKIRRAVIAIFTKKNPIDIPTSHYAITAF